MAISRPTGPTRQATDRQASKVFAPRAVACAATAVLLACTGPGNSPSVAGSQQGPQDGQVVDIYGQPDADTAEDGLLADSDPADGAPSQDLATTAECSLAHKCSDSKRKCYFGKCKDPIACASDKHCTAAGLVCDLELSQCVECLGVVDCPADHSCKQKQCVPPPPTCKSSKECPNGYLCDQSAGICVMCLTEKDCGPGESCIDAMCLPPVCQSGETKCLDAATVATCNAGGTAYSSSVCPTDKTCLAGNCVVKTCSPAATQCMGTVAQLCDPKTLTWVNSTDCATTGQQCLAGACVATGCVVGSQTCDGDNLAICQAGGTYKTTPCNDGNSCTTDGCNAATGCSFMPISGCDGATFKVHATFAVTGPMIGGGYAIRDNGFSAPNSCGGGYCIQAGVQP